MQRAKRRTIIIVMSSLMTLTFLISAFSLYHFFIRDQKWIEDEMIVFTISLDHDRISSNGRFNANCTITNENDRSMKYLYHFSLKIHIQDSNGTDIRYIEPVYEYVPPSRSNIISLRPGESRTYREFISFEKGVLKGWETYSVFATFTSSDQFYFVPYWKGVLISNTEIFSVI